MLGDVNLNADDGDESLNDMFIHLFSSNYAFLNLKVIQTPLMKPEML